MFVPFGDNFMRIKGNLYGDGTELPEVCTMDLFLEDGYKLSRNVVPTDFEMTVSIPLGEAQYYISFICDGYVPVKTKQFSSQNYIINVGNIMMKQVVDDG